MWKGGRLGPLFGVDGKTQERDRKTGGGGKMEGSYKKAKDKVGNQRRKITREQEHQLVQIFLHSDVVGGVEVVEQMCLDLGLSINYARNRVLERFGTSHTRKFRRKRGAKPGKPRSKRISDLNDPRWAWAIERGPVVI